jgi:Flp pilus assembly protein TadD
MGEDKGAEIFADQALIYRDNDYEALMAKVRLHRRQQQHRRAVLVLRTLVEHHPARAEPYLLLADSHAVLGDRRGEEDALRKGFAATRDERIRARLDALGRP